MIQKNLKEIEKNEEKKKLRRMSRKIFLKNGWMKSRCQWSKNNTNEGINKLGQVK